MSGGTFVAALVLGAWANRSSEAEAIRKWERNHFPSARLFRYSMESYGLKRIQDSKTLQKVLRSLPASLDDRGSIWMANQDDWIVYYSSFQEMEAQVFVGEGNAFPARWQLLGSGWSSFELVLNRLEAKKKQTRLFLRPKKVRIWRDPREIVY